MNYILPILPILAMIGTGLSTLTAVVFCLGMGANAKPPEIRALKVWMLALTLLGGAGVTLGVILLRADQPTWAAIASITPTVIFGIILSVALLK